ncbi:MAG TPA: hypothetical protein VIK25_09795, partial [Gemmatimonadaceae bacterium]
MDELALAHQLIHERTVAASLRVAHCALPIVREDARRRPEVIASSVLVTFPPRHFLLTAEHAISSDSRSATYVPIGSKLLKLSGAFIGTMPADPGAKDLDVAFLPLSESLVADIGTERFLTKDNISPWNAPRPG